MPSLFQKVFRREGAELRAEKFVLNAVLARTKVLDKGGDLQLGKLRPDTNYTHTLELVRNYALWPLEITVTNSVRDKSKLRYIGLPAEEWEFAVSIDPHHGSGEYKATVECLAGASGESEMLSQFFADGGYSDSLGLGVAIG